MSIPDPDPQLRSAAFPRLSDHDIAALAAYAERRAYADGDTLFSVGEADADFFVILAGRVEVIEYSAGEPHTIVTHEAGNFTGDVWNLADRPAIASGVARGPVEVLQISPDGLHRIIREAAELGDLILRAFIARRQLLEAADWFTGLRVIGSRFSGDSHRVREFLSRSRVPFTWIDLDTHPRLDARLRGFNVRADDIPVVAYGNEVLLRNPSNADLAEALGIRHTVDESLVDLIVVGAGPAGLAAAVYAASEGLATVVLERDAPGGQAGSSSRIENYLGFPTGISGGDLTARAVLQAEKFGARLTVASRAARVSITDGYPAVELESGERIAARTLLIATGADYRKLDVPGREKYDGAGVYYAATQVEVQSCQDAPVMVVGGGNSAGQAAIFLASAARELWLLIRGDDLGRSMSHYLVQRIEQTANIRVLLNTEVVALHGERMLRGVEIHNRDSGETSVVPTEALFTFIGAVPRTDWLPPEIETDAAGFVATGRAVARRDPWPAGRPPLLLETSCPGIFAAGDVRTGSAKRVAAAVGDGAMAVQLIHEYLAEP